MKRSIRNLPINILCVIDSLGSGGAQRQLVELAKGFKYEGYKVSFLVYHEDNFFKSELDKINISLNIILEPNYLRRLFKMRKFIRNGHFDVVLSFLEASNFICEFSGFPWKKWKIIVGERSANPYIFKSIKRKFYRWFHLFADRVVANSHANLEIVKKINPLLPENKCKVIYNLVDSNYWLPAGNYKVFENGKLNLVVAASHRHLKNAKGLIEAIHGLDKEQRDKIEVNWYGDEKEDNSFGESLKMIEDYGLQKVLNFHNATTNIRNKIQYADVVGLFSFYEGFPNTICEAMMIGKPIISSSVSDIPNMFSNDSRFIFDPHNPHEIQQSLLYVLSLSPNELIQLGKNNREIAYKLFNKEKIISSYIDLFD